MKFALFLVCALVAFQGYHARSVEPENRDLDSIADTIKELIEKLKQIIANISSQIPEIIQNIKDKIKEVIGKLNNIIQEIKKKIEELISLGTAGKKCVEQHRADIEALVQQAQNGVQACTDAAQGQTEALQKQIAVLVDKANAVKDDVVSRALKCYEDNKLNPVGLVKCLREQVEPIKAQAEELAKEVANTIEVAKQTAQEVGESLSECVGKVQQEVAVKEQEILASIKKCIDDSN